MVNKMKRIAKLCKRNLRIDKEKYAAKFVKKKIKSFLDKGCLVKVDKNSYLLFEKEEHCLVLYYLERILFDLFKNIKFEKEEKEIRVFFSSIINNKMY